MGKNGYYGAIIGDIVGSVFEETERAASDFPIFSKRSHFTDDTVLTWATMELMLKGRIQKNDQRAIAETYREWAKRFPNAGYGWNFIEWIDDPDMGPYASKGNGAAMRVSPVAYFSSSEKECLRFAEISAIGDPQQPRGREQREGDCPYDLSSASRSFKRTAHKNGAVLLSRDGERLLFVR
jgi:ADP-ribosylglycohydrolase